MTFINSSSQATRRPSPAPPPTLPRPAPTIAALFRSALGGIAKLAGRPSRAPLIAIDCEMIQARGTKARGKMVAARVALVDEHENTLMDQYIFHDPKNVKDYGTQYSGIRRADCDGSTHPTLSISQTRLLIMDIIKDKTLVGHGIRSDLDALSWPRGEVEAICSSVIDTQKLDWGDRHSTGLATLTAELFNTTIQSGEHCPVEDAKYTVMLAKYHEANGVPPLATVIVEMQVSEAAARTLARLLIHSRVTLASLINPRFALAGRLLRRRLQPTRAVVAATGRRAPLRPSLRRPAHHRVPPLPELPATQARARRLLETRAFVQLRGTGSHSLRDRDAGQQPHQAPPALA